MQLGEELADQVCDAWDKGEIDDITAWWAWLIVAGWIYFDT